jgi:hypothetical protein
MSPSLKRILRLAAMVLLSFPALHAGVGGAAEARDAILPLSAFPRETIAIEHALRAGTPRGLAAATPEMRGRASCSSMT